MSDDTPRGKRASQAALDRRPLRYWQRFNDWWRSEFDRHDRRPTAEEIIQCVSARGRRRRAVRFGRRGAGGVAAVAAPPGRCCTAPAAPHARARVGARRSLLRARRRRARTAPIAT